MRDITFATTNPEKIQIAETVCAEASISLTTVALEIDEIQGEDPEIIVSDKAKRAYEILGKPLVVSDDSWDIKSLNGFPGPYMKSINHWFTAQDFLRLMEGAEDRSVTLHQYLGYISEDGVKIFKNDIHGTVINEQRGENKRSPNMSVIALDFDNGKTIAEVFELGSDAVIERYQSRPDVWHSFVEWYNN